MLVSQPAGAGLTFYYGTNDKCKVTATYHWDGAPDAKVIPPPNKNPPNPWSGSVTAAAALAGVSATLQHSPGNPECDKGHGLNATPLKLKTRTSIVPKRPEIGTARRIVSDAAMVDHDPKHFDYGLLRSAVTLDNTENGLPIEDFPRTWVQVRALHEKKKDKIIKPSLTNQTKKKATVNIIPDYRRDNGDGTYVVEDDTEQQQTFDIQPGTKKSKGLKPFKNKLENGGILASYKMIIEQSPKTETHIAFLGDYNGFFTELDLDIAPLLFGVHEWFLPNLRPVIGDDTTDLYVGVDLTQWLGAEATFGFGDIFDIDAGLSDLLPGFFVGLSEVTLGDSGWVSDQPFTGQVHANMIIDGHIPEPATLLLFAVGLLGLAVIRRRFG